MHCRQRCPHFHCLTRWVHSNARVHISMDFNARHGALSSRCDAAIFHLDFRNPAIVGRGGSTSPACFAEAVALSLKERSRVDATCCWLARERDAEGRRRRGSGRGQELRRQRQVAGRVSLGRWRRSTIISTGRRTSATQWSRRSRKSPPRSSACVQRRPTPAMSRAGCNRPSRAKARATTTCQPGWRRPSRNGLRECRLRPRPASTKRSTESQWADCCKARRAIRRAAA
jgi:hypothetical protein